ncbi:HTH domain-containing protein [uncultured Bifidobacterium sp.]|uniref:HTH domain-containing protein n=1 Tax=uncultured Bifidobacterium sp. TaxID=165187 RepID=UPI002589527A|nr:HTH domain-containing protein [uncultured Bifidobacterium sp.]
MRRKFTPDEISYLRGLWAVSNVTPTRIIYSDEFKGYFLREHGKGRGPTEIFRDAGLPVLIIGRKRIERCVARWVRPDRVDGSMVPAPPEEDGLSMAERLLAATRDLLDGLFELLSRTERIIHLLEEERRTVRPDHCRHQ